MANQLKLQLAFLQMKQQNQLVIAMTNKLLHFKSVKNKTNKKSIMSP